MKAIDFACRLLARLAKDEMPDGSQRVLLAVAAGLPEAPDIARLTGLAPTACAQTLARLRKQGFVLCNDAIHGGHILTPTGKAKVAGFFDFMHPDHA